MKILNLRILTGAILICLGVYLLCPFLSWGKPASGEDIVRTCTQKGNNAYSKCVGAGSDASLCADIGNRTYQNCVERMLEAITGTKGGRNPSPSPLPGWKPPTPIGVAQPPPSKSPPPLTGKPIIHPPVTGPITTKSPSPSPTVTLQAKSKSTPPPHEDHHHH